MLSWKALGLCLCAATCLSATERGKGQALEGDFWCHGALPKSVCAEEFPALNSSWPQDLILSLSPVDAPAVVLSKTSPTCSGSTEFIQFLCFPVFDIPSLSFFLGFCPLCALQDTAEQESPSAQDTQPFQGPRIQGECFYGHLREGKKSSQSRPNLFLMAENHQNFVRPSYN